VLLPRPARRPTLMVGSTGERVLAATLPHVDAWNTWFDWFGNSPERFASSMATVDRACERAGRDPATVERSACVLVRLDEGSGERGDTSDAPAVRGEDVNAAVAAMGEAGADEVILVCDPITEASVGTLGRALALDAS
jgi:alkanesulfonate monooxygenase SsuD/methylene tetrahydromethanopterin reductase-like flavin-dependent oxidoreductase (luciferase family)